MVRDLDDGSLLILYVGPRRSGVEGDLDAEQAIGEKLRRGLGGIPGIGGPGDMMVSMAHCWSDAVDLRDGMSDPLALVTPEPLEENKRAAA